MKHILSFSGGKDSTCLLLELIERKCPLDEVVFFDTGWEYPVMYAHIEKCKKICEENSIKFTTLKPEKSFDYYMFEHKTKSGKTGYSWCGGNCRWGTRLKINSVNSYFKGKDKIIYVGIAFDEQYRAEREKNEFKRCPLIDWEITESQCLDKCYKSGFDWGGMYEHLDRLSCKFCRNKNLKELRNIRKHYHSVWEELKEYQRKTSSPYRKSGSTIFDLEKRFEFEEERTEKGLSISNRDFRNELRKILDVDCE